MGLALAYTTPWDNYLVATRVWWYDPDLVTGIVLGYVPLEEYIFFLAQTLFTGLWLYQVIRVVGVDSSAGSLNPRLRWRTASVATLLWLGSIFLLFREKSATTYLALELSWALLPITVQLAFGADILWRRRRIVLWALLPPTLYLSSADALAILSGTWTIDPAQSTGIMLGGVLPIEEFLFFFLTNTMVVFGALLMTSEESHARVKLPWRSTSAYQSGKRSRSAQR